MTMQIPDKDLAILDTDNVDDPHGPLLPGRLNELSFLKPAYDWNELPSFRRTHVHADEWFVQCAFYGSEQLKSCVDVDPEIRGGVPVLKGSRFTVSETLAELAESSAVEDIAENFDLNKSSIRDLLNGLSLLLNQPFPK
jgi:uncharacterized protein (DUF433 family)